MNNDKWGVDEDHGFIDQPHFHEYCVRVAKVIKKGSTSIGSMKRAMGDDFSERMHIDALEALLSAGEIQERLSGSLTRYEPFKVRRLPPDAKFNKAPSPPADRTIPWGHLEDNRHRVTA